MERGSVVLIFMCLALGARDAAATVRSGLVSMDFDLSA